MPTETPPENSINEDNLNALVGGILQDLGDAFSKPLVQIGESLGLYRALAQNDGLTPEELSEKTGLYERYLRERLSAQAASNYISFDADSGQCAGQQKRHSILYSRRALNKQSGCIRIVGASKP